MSSAKDLGTRHVCWKCEAKFYDLNKPSPACPKCGADPRENPALKAPVAKPVKVAAPAPAAKTVKRRSDDDEEELEDDSFDDLGDDEEIEEEAEAEEDDIF